MKVNSLEVGPIVGWTQDESCRIWGRGNKGQDDEYCFGVARIREKGKRRYKPHSVCKMLPVFDYTGVVDFTDLTPDTEYEYEFGYLHKVAEPSDVQKLRNLDWSQADKGSFRTENTENARSTSFVFGSCRYLLKLFGGSFFDGRGDKVFRSISNQIANGHKTDFALMVGDQIYADDLNAAFPDKTIDEYFSRYRDVFGQENIRKLMANLPTYMILDDHEIRDNWSNDDRKANANLYAAAMHSYQCYQMVHGPAFKRNSSAEQSEVPDDIWYDFLAGSSAFFVLDTRTERTRRSEPPEMISITQMDSLKSWLSSEANTSKQKFIVSSVPMFPDGRRLNKDKWQGFDEQRCELLDYIRENQIRHVVFLSGDIHCSLSAQVKCSKDPEFVVTSVVSSSFFWPYPQGQASTYRLAGTLTESKGAIYTVENASQVYSKDNFTRIRVKDDQIRINVFDRKGGELTKKPIKYRI